MFVKLKAWQRVWLLALVVFVSSRPATILAQDSDHGTQIDAGEVAVWATAFFEEHLPASHIPDAGLVMVQDGEVLLIACYGEANPITGTPFDPQCTVFDIVSVTKLFTYLSVMQIIEQGRVAPDDPVNPYLGAYRVPQPFGIPVTVKHLMLHTVVWFFVTQP